MFKGTSATEPPKTTAPATPKPVTEDELHG